MICGSRGATVFEACGAARAAAAASKTSATKQVRILMAIPSALILSAPLPVEKLFPPAYNLLSGLSRRAAAWYKEFLPAVPFRWMGHRSAPGTKETLNGLRDCRAVHRHKRHRVCGCLPRGLHPYAQGRTGLRGRDAALHPPDRMHRLRSLRTRLPGDRYFRA